MVLYSQQDLAKKQIRLENYDEHHWKLTYCCEALSCAQVKLIVLVTHSVIQRQALALLRTHCNGQVSPAGYRCTVGYSRTRKPASPIIRGRLLEH